MPTRYTRLAAALLFIASVGASGVGAQSWSREYVLPGRSTQVESLSAKPLTSFTVTTASPDGSERFRFALDATTGDLESLAPIEGLCGPLADRVGERRYLRFTSDTAGFTVEGLRYDRDCRPTVEFATRYALGAADTVYVGAGGLDESRGHYYLHVMRALTPPQFDFEYEQLLYVLDPTDGEVLAIRSAGVRTSRNPSLPGGVAAVVEGIGVYTIRRELAANGAVEYTAFEPGAAGFRQVAEGNCGVAPLAVVANSAGQFVVTSLGCGRDGGSTFYQHVNQDGAIIARTEPLGASAFGGSRPDVTATAIATNGDALVAGRLLSDERAGGTPTGSFVQRSDLRGDSILTRVYPDPVAAFAAVAPVGDRGALAAGTYPDGRLLVVRIDASLSSVHDLATVPASVYPNPTSDYATVGAGVVLAQAEPYGLYDATGRLVRAGNLDAAGRLDLSDRAPGHYVVVLPRVRARATVSVLR